MAELLRSGRWDDGKGFFDSVTILGLGAFEIQPQPAAAPPLRKADQQMERLATSLYSACREWLIDQQRKTK